VRKHYLGRTHHAPEELAERAQRKRKAGEARVVAGARRSQREAPGVRQARRKRLRRPFRPLTPQVGVI
jgi:hypothetical protein